jgi:hypothetical protein
LRGAAGELKINFIKQTNYVFNKIKTFYSYNNYQNYLCGALNGDSPPLVMVSPLEDRGDSLSENETFRERIGE